MSPETHKLIVLFGLLTGVTLNLLLVITFYFAYFNGFKTLVAINTYGEAQVEAFLFVPGSFAFLCVALYYGIKIYRTDVIAKHTISYGGTGSSIIHIRSKKEVET